MARMRTFACKICGTGLKCSPEYWPERRRTGAKRFVTYLLGSNPNFKPRHVRSQARAPALHTKLGHYHLLWSFELRVQICQTVADGMTDGDCDGTCVFRIQFFRAATFLFPASGVDCS